MRVQLHHYPKRRPPTSLASKLCIVVCAMFIMLGIYVSGVYYGFAATWFALAFWAR